MGQNNYVIYLVGLVWFKDVYESVEAEVVILYWNWKTGSGSVVLQLNN